MKKNTKAIKVRGLKRSSDDTPPASKSLAKGDKSPLKDRYFIYTNFILFFYVLLGVTSLVAIDFLLKDGLWVYTATAISAAVVGLYFGLTKPIRAAFDHIIMNRVRQKGQINFTKKGDHWIANIGSTVEKKNLRKLIFDEVGGQLKALDSTAKAAIGQIFIDDDNGYSVVIAHSCPGYSGCDNPDYHMAGIPEAKDAA